MSDDRDADRDDYRPLTARERGLVIASSVVGFIVGVWIGLVSVPDAALTVPMVTEYGTTTPAYLPVPTWMPVITLVGVGIVIWVLWNVFASHDPVGDEEVETDV